MYNVRIYIIEKTVNIELKFKSIIILYILYILQLYIIIMYIKLHIHLKY